MLRMRAVILSSFLLALGFLRAEQPPSSSVGPSISWVVGVAHAVVVVAQLCLMPPFFPTGVIKRTAGGQKTTQQQLYKFHPNCLASSPTVMWGRLPLIDLTFDILVPKGLPSVQL